MKNLAQVDVGVARLTRPLTELIKTITIMGSVAALLFLAGPLLAQNAPYPSGPARERPRTSIRIKLASVFVDDQDKALRFYTEVVGFVKKSDVPVGKAKWLTVVSPNEPDGAELLLEPSDNPAASTFKKAVFEQGIPFTAFLVEDVEQEYERMRKLGAVFTLKPTNTGPTKIAVFDDTCGNLIQLYQIVRK